MLLRPPKQKPVKILSYPGSVCRHKTNSVAFSPQANFIDWATATCRGNLVRTFADRGVSRGQGGGCPSFVNLSFLSSSSSFILARAELTPFQTHCYPENLAGPGIGPGTSGIAARKSDHYTTEATLCSHNKSYLRKRDLSYCKGWNAPRRFLQMLRAVEYWCMVLLYMGGAAAVIGCLACNITPGIEAIFQWQWHVIDYREIRFPLPFASFGRLRSGVQIFATEIYIFLLSWFVLLQTST
jgi:hypothetical protein